MNNKLWVWIGLGAAAILGALYVSGVIGPQTAGLSLPAVTEVTEEPATAEPPKVSASAPASEPSSETAESGADPAAPQGAAKEVAGTEADADEDAASASGTEIALALPEDGAPAVEAEVAPNTDSEDAAATEDPVTPSFDLVRAEPGGLVTVAGRAEPGSEVVLLLDGAEELTSRVGSDGRFAAFFDLPASDVPQVLRLRMTADGEQIESQQEVILTPPVTPRVAGEQGEADAETELASAGTGEAPEAAAPTVLLSDAGGVEVMQGAQPLAPGGVAIDAITYDDTGGVELSGRGNGEAFLRVYLDNSEITTLQVAADGRWQVALPQVDAGTYTLRVDQIDAGGKVSARAESPFRREPPEKLAAAAAELPGAEEVSAVTVQPGNTLWAIARERYGDGMAYVRLFEANKTQIRDPDLIYPGQIFDFPE
ncbi:LysM peptidoglycan-binding domain-containing protein [Alloyangia pacifica]|uniref:LysM peptidoglycan-binding domain-containing protein n=1 Tax=Alloyangia pacifica TaxID=311180 RepID=UPI001CFF5372|nr:LysM peptidoglycan-binding domain-containing protein [Alloyangia pacifica]